jgi:hypothetical protein
MTQLRMHLRQNLFFGCLRLLIWLLICLRLGDVIPSNLSNTERIIISTSSSQPIKTLEVFLMKNNNHGIQFEESKASSILTILSHFLHDIQRATGFDCLKFNLHQQFD